MVTPDDETNGPGETVPHEIVLPEIVLPWWQHPMNIATMVVTAALLAAMVGWSIGTTAAEPDYNEVDVGFLHDMREHHEQAVQMSLIYRTRADTDPGLDTIARSVIFGQSIEIGRMVQLLDLFNQPQAREGGVPMLWMDMGADADMEMDADMDADMEMADEPMLMPGMATQDELLELGRLNGRDADELFVELMSAHHRGGIQMAEFAVDNAANDRVVRMAAGMAHGQVGEIAEMEGVLAD